MSTYMVVTETRSCGARIEAAGTYAPSTVHAWRKEHRHEAPQGGQEARPAPETGNPAPEDPQLRRSAQDGAEVDITCEGQP